MDARKQHPMSLDWVTPLVNHSQVTGQDNDSQSHQGASDSKSLTPGISVNPHSGRNDSLETVALLH